WWFYMVVDAYQTAKAKQRGLPLPDPFGFERMGANQGWFAQAPPQSPPGAGAAGNPGAGAASPATGQPVMYSDNLMVRDAERDIDRGELMQAADARGAASGPPVGAIVLVAVGALFMMNTMGVIHGIWLRQFWPVIL